MSKVEIPERFQYPPVNNRGHACDPVDSCASNRESPVQRITSLLPSYLV